METETRIIKKYPNRRLYDTGESRYIKLTEVKKMIEDEIPVKVVDSQTEEDITRSILLQIILEQESNQEPLFSTANLENFIRYNAESSREGFMHFMDHNLKFFQDQQKQVQEKFNEMLDFNPLDFWAKSTQQNADMWQKMQDNFLKSSGFNKSSDDKKK